MIIRCTKTFETREGGTPATVDEGTVWYKATHRVAPGGYELMVLERVEGGAFMGEVVQVRLDRIADSFEAVPPADCVVPVGCSELGGRTTE